MVSSAKKNTKFVLYMRSTDQPLGQICHYHDGGCYFSEGDIRDAEMLARESGQGTIFAYLGEKDIINCVDDRGTFWPTEMPHYIAQTVESFRAKHLERPASTEQSADPDPEI